MICFGLWLASLELLHAGCANPCPKLSDQDEQCDCDFGQQTMPMHHNAEQYCSSSGPLQFWDFNALLPTAHYEILMYYQSTGKMHVLQNLVVLRQPSSAVRDEFGVAVLQYGLGTQRSTAQSCSQVDMPEAELIVKKSSR